MLIIYKTIGSIIVWLWIALYSYILVVPSMFFNYGYKMANLGKYLIQTLLCFWFKYILNIKIYETINIDNDKVKEKENNKNVEVIISNHCSTMDFLYTICYLKSKGIDRFYFVMKKQIVYIPIIGLLMSAGLDIKINRNWNTDEEIFKKDIKKIIDQNEKCAIIIYVEGARITAEKQLQGQKYSRENNLPIFNNLLVPRTKGFELICNELINNNKLGNIWDLTFIRNKNLFVYCRKINYDKNVKQLLINLWVTKDKFIDNYKQYLYKEIDFTFNSTNIINLTIILFMAILMFNFIHNRNTQLYLLISFIISYVLIIKKI